ncbi:MULTISPECIES: ribonuclease P protein component [Aerosakkonema]|uniref:ribonuclease P protein component n=1 Tax=Aerosakkonema TaxID=1246629 RepID=UPI0035BAAB74
MEHPTPVALPKANRLKHRDDFSAVFRKGIRRSSANLTLRALRKSADSDRDKRSPPKESEVPSRIGISVSQKVSKRAVIRNRIKRLLRAAFRHLLPRLKKGWCLVVVVKPEAQRCEYQQFLQELEQLLAEAEVLNGHS